MLATHLLPLCTMAKNWLSPAEIARDSKIFAAFTLVLCGMAAWNVISTLTFDISIIRGKRTWRWPMVLYYVCRICMLLHIFALAVNLNAISQIPCQEVTWISKVSDAIGTCGSSLILILRTRAVWHRSNKVTIPLALLFCGQIALWCQTFRYSRAQWNAQRNVCAVVSTAPKPLLVAVFAYTMAFDLVILLLCAFRLYNSRRTSNLSNLLLRDGIGYFCAAFGANFIQTVLASLGLNPVMNIIALPFALVVSVIAATTVFRNVFTAYDSFAFSSSNPATGSGSRNNDSARGPNHINLSQTMISAGDIPLSNFKAQQSLAVHQTIDIDVDGVPMSHTRTHVMDPDDLSLTEKGHGF